LPSLVVIDPITEDEVYLQIFQLNSIKLTEPENIPIKFVGV